MNKIKKTWDDKELRADKCLTLGKAVCHTGRGRSGTGGNYRQGILYTLQDTMQGTLQHPLTDLVAGLLLRLLRPLLVILMVAVSLIGCSHYSSHFTLTKQDLPSAEQQCLNWYANHQADIDRQQLGDASVHRLPGFPFLRSDRFLASLTDRIKSPQHYKEWLQHLNKTAISSMYSEWRNTQASLNRPWTVANDRAFKSQLNDCGEILVDWLVEQPWQDRVYDQAQVKDHYQPWKRVLGLYPLAILPFRSGVVQEHQRTEDVFKQFTDGPKDLLKYRHYVPVISTKNAPTLEAHVGAIANASESDGRHQFYDTLHSDLLGVPDLDKEQQHILLEQWAPEFMIEQKQDNDVIGVWQIKKGQAVLDTSESAVYQYVSFGRFQQQVTIQLNYVIWFRERLATRAVDVLAGELDGLVLRVHLSLSGELLAMDSVHNCGCWYQLYLPKGMVSDKHFKFYQEPVFISELPDTALPITEPSITKQVTHRPQRAKIFVAANTHFVEALEWATDKRKSGVPVKSDLQNSTQREYQMLPYDQLQHLGVRSPESCLSKNSLSKENLAKEDLSKAALSKKGLPEENSLKADRSNNDRPACIARAESTDSDLLAPSQSLFDRQGLIRRSQRLERFLFWPMGISSPGAMRVRGTQAMAFIGRRHFDDPTILDDLGVRRAVD